MRRIAALTSVLLLVAHVAAAQGIDEPLIRLGGFELVATGSERPLGVARLFDAMPVGKTTVGLFSTSGCGSFALTVPPNQFEPNAVVGWRVEVTPMRIVEHAVTFRLRWTRSVGVNARLSAAEGDAEVTLKPGESRPIDTVPSATAGGVDLNGKPCPTTAYSLRVSVEWGDFEPRLFSADLWLVDRRAATKGASQLQTVRGEPHHRVPFYFDGLTDGKDRVDVFGTLVAEPEPGGLVVAIEAIQARTRPPDDGYHAARWFRATLHLKGDEIVEVSLPSDDASTSPPYAGDGMFAIRIRARPLR